MFSHMVTTKDLAATLRVRGERISEWAREGLIPSTVVGGRSKPRRVFDVGEVTAALGSLLRIHGRVYREGPRGDEVRARARERKEGRHRCNVCKVTRPRSEYPPSALKSGAYVCHECRKLAKRAARQRAGGESLEQRSTRLSAERAERKATRRAELQRQAAERAANRLSPEERTKRSVDRQRERYNTDPEYQARIKAKKIRRKRAMEGTRVEPVSTLAVAERDGWRCGICGKRVTRATWSLDHIVPLSRGGAHVYANVTLAHRRCNSRRGVGRLAVQLPLFAK